MKKWIPILLIAALLLAALPVGTFAHTADEPFVVTLWAGQNINAGTVSVWNDGDNLYVKYETTDGWELLETHLAVATNPDDIPQANGNPIPGQFPYKHEDLGGVTVDLYTIPLVDIPASAEDTIYIAAHAELEKPGECEEIPTTWVQGELGSVTLWAGQHINAGTVTVAIVGENLVVTYETTDGWELLETHLYVGTDAPTDSAPGQFPYKNEDLGGVTSDTYSILLSGLGVECDGTLYIAAHAALQKLTGYEEDGTPIYQTETGWGAGQPIDDGTGNWAVYFSVVLPCGTEEVCKLEEETAWGAGIDFPGKNWAMYFPYEIQGVEILVEWPEGGTITVAFEDLQIASSSDYDYNDWVADIETLATFWGTEAEHSDLLRIDFTITPEARGAGYNHVFHLAIPAGTFGCNGTYTLTINGTSETGAFYASTDNDFVVIPWTYNALPGTLTNTIEPPGIVSHYPNINNTDPAAPQHQPYVPPQVTATLSIEFSELCPFDFSVYDPYNPEKMHGEGLFFDPYLHVVNWNGNINQGDPRMLTVPVDWMWPEAGVAIWKAYPDVTAGNPPTFTAEWWVDYNDLVYEGKP